MTVAKDRRTFFLAGTMQGSRPGAEQTDQSYRTALTECIRRRYPHASVNCPGALMQRWLGAGADSIRASHARLAAPGIVDARLREPSLARLTGAFHRLVDLAANSDVCVAWLPEHEASMGTAVEMWSAFSAGRRVIAITPMRQNLTVLACSSLIVPTLAEFDSVLASGYLDA